MLEIGEQQFQALAADAARAYPAALAAHCERLGLDSAGARALADHAHALGRSRGLTDADEFEALAEVIAAHPRAEPGWAYEITAAPGHNKADRLRACLRATAHG